MPSSHNFSCQRCGWVYRSEFKREDWDGKRKKLIVCKYCKDRVPPNEYPIKLPKGENMPVKNASPVPTEINVFTGMKWNESESLWDEETDYWEEA